MVLAEIPIELIRACQAGDRQATERLLERVSPDVYRIVFSMLRDHDETDEVVQETLVRLFRHIRKLKDPKRFSAWVMRIAVNQVQTWRMQRVRRRAQETPVETPPEHGALVVTGTAAPNPRDAAANGEVRRAIEDAIAALPRRQQMALVLFELEGCSIREVADAMACSEGAVKFNLHEARRKLQARLAHLVRAWTAGAEWTRRGDSAAEAD